MARVEFTKDSLTPGLANFSPVVKRNIYQVLRFHESGIASRAKANAPWIDRTGNARNGLRATVAVEGPNTYALILYHSVSYGIWLEVAHAGRYAIIMPTIYEYLPMVLGSLNQLLERMNMGGAA